MRYFLLPFLCTSALLAQYPGLTLPPSGNNQKASVIQWIGPVRVSIDYSSPSVHTTAGKDRRGEIWGKLVPYGLTAQGFGNGKPIPWRAGANENTVFAVSHNVMIDGKPLAAGRYGLHMITGESEWTLVFSKNAGAWGSFFYEDSEDALRVAVKPHKHDYREYLTYEFPIRQAASAGVELQWEELAVGWTIQVPNPNEIYVSRLKQELTSVPGFSWQGFQAAAQFTLSQNTNLEQGLVWAEDAVSRPFIGVTNFSTLSTKAQVLAKMGREKETAETMQTALKLPGTTSLRSISMGGNC